MKLKQRNTIKARERKRKYYLAHREEILKKKRERYNANKDELNAAARAKTKAKPKVNAVDRYVSRVLSNCEFNESLNEDEYGEIGCY